MKKSLLAVVACAIALGSVSIPAHAATNQNWFQEWLDGLDYGGTKNTTQPNNGGAPNNSWGPVPPRGDKYGEHQAPDRDVIPPKRKLPEYQGRKK